MLSSDHFFSIATIIASASHCRRRKVGAVIVKDGRIVGTGYNGTPAGWPNECEVGGVTSGVVIHAEENAILNATTSDLRGAKMYLTLSPCLHCAAKIAQVGISEVYYLDEYRDVEGVVRLREQGLLCAHIGVGKF